ncbi:hypothetical protein PLICRDRAFT_109487 [Plicaturopsis crispa FD-325 SS-3]|nr:hypothetical protein PLICRDRAFT_109487 [Plicaturopsis crispa FD-325 SS-3]
MAINADEDTEFNDALRKHGILPPRPEAPPSPSPPASPTLSDFLDDFTPSELQERAEDAKDPETERLIEEYRRHRIAQDRNEEKKARFGRVYPISREDYTREVTEASMVDEEDDDDERGTGVVCFLYKDGITRSDLASRHVQILAARHPRTKFVSIVGDKCIANLPDTRVPMFIIYRKGEVLNQLVSWGADRERKIEGTSHYRVPKFSDTNCHHPELEGLLMVAGAIVIPERRRPGDRRRGSDSDEDDSEEEDRDPSSRMRSAATSTNARSQKNVRGPAKKDEDSDSDFDL